MRRLSGSEGETLPAWYVETTDIALQAVLVTAAAEGGSNSKESTEDSSITDTQIHAQSSAEEGEDDHKERGREEEERVKWSGDKMGQCEARAGTEGKCDDVKEDEGGEGRR